MAKNEANLARLLSELYRARDILGVLPDLEGLESAYEAALSDERLEALRGPFISGCGAYQASVIRLKNTVYWLIDAAERAAGR